MLTAGGIHKWFLSKGNCSIKSGEKLLGEYNSKPYGTQNLSS